MDTLEILNNEYFLAILTAFVMTYSFLSRPELPKWVSNLFKNDIFKIAFLSLIVMIPANQAPHVAIVVAIIFVMTLNFLSQQEMRETVAIAENFIGTLKHTEPLRVQKQLAQNKHN